MLGSVVIVTRYKHWTSEILLNHFLTLNLLSFLDTVIPVITFIDLPSTTNGSPVFKWRASKEMDFMCSLDNESYEPCGEGITGEWRRNNVPEGSHVFAVRGKDSRGEVLVESTLKGWIVGMSFILMHNI